MSNKKVCPHCGSSMFMAKITKAAVVEYAIDSENNFTILNENKDKFDVELVKCAGCKADITENDLVMGVKCKECGVVVSSNDINEHGLCNVCVAKHERSELANASKEDLIRMLLEAEKKANPVAIRMEKTVEKSKKVAESIVTDDTTNQDTNVENSSETKKVKTKAKKKKEETVTEVIENNDNITVSNEKDPNAALNYILQQQEAPFPDVQMSQESVFSSMNEPIVEEQPIGAEFKMFDNEDPF